MRAARRAPKQRFKVAKQGTARIQGGHLPIYAFYSLIAGIIGISIMIIPIGNVSILSGIDEALRFAASHGLQYFANPVIVLWLIPIGLVLAILFSIVGVVAGIRGGGRAQSIIKTAGAFVVVAGALVFIGSFIWLFQVFDTTVVIVVFVEVVVASTLMNAGRKLRASVW